MNLLCSLAGLAMVCALCACWVIPWRLMSESWYTFGFIGDEYLYAMRVQPLLAGATVTNPVNGICDPTILSPFYLEDLLRAVLTAAHVSVVAFVWAWRWLFPIALLASLHVLARVCLRHTKRPWRSALRWSFTAAALPFLLLTYDLVTTFPPLQGFINRFPTNIEYPLSVLLAALYLKFLDNPTARRGMALALASAVVAYLRPYLALPWSIVIFVGFAVLMFRRQVSARTIVATAAVLAAAMCPWLIVSHRNGQSRVFIETCTRYFGPAARYAVHDRWCFYLMLGIALGCGALMLERGRRLFVAGAAVAMLALPFVCGLLPFASELLQFDRMGSFYLVALLAAAMLIVDARAARWRGHEGQALARRFAMGTLVAAFAANGCLAFGNATYDFAKYPFGPIPSIREDLPLVPAYLWLRDNTAPDSLVLVDDGYDWSVRPRRTPAGRPIVSSFSPDGAYLLARDDLFQVVAQRRRPYTERLMTCMLATKDLGQLAYLQRGALGLPVPAEEFYAAVRRFRPTHILWRKGREPVPRGFGRELQPPGRSKVVYQDAVCEVWELLYPTAGTPGEERQ